MYTIKPIISAIYKCDNKDYNTIKKLYLDAFDALKLYQESAIRKEDEDKIIIISNELVNSFDKHVYENNNSFIEAKAILSSQLSNVIPIIMNNLVSTEK